MFWSPDRLATVASRDDAWRKAKAADPDVETFVERALAKRRCVVGILY